MSRHVAVDHKLAMLFWAVAALCVVRVSGTSGLGGLPQHAQGGFAQRVLDAKGPLQNPAAAQFFQQPLDHSKYFTQSFAQKFYVDDQYYDNGATLLASPGPTMPSTRGVCAIS